MTWFRAPNTYHSKLTSCSEWNDYTLEWLSQMASLGRLVTQSVDASMTSSSGRAIYPEFSTKDSECWNIKNREYILREALRSNSSCVFDWDPEKWSIELDMHEMFQFGNEGIITISQNAWLESIHPDDRPVHREMVKAFLKGGYKTQSFNLDYRIKVWTNEYMWINSRGLVEVDASWKLKRVIGQHTNINYRKEVERKLLHGAENDNLTWLPNREKFYSILENLLREREKDKPNEADAIQHFCLFFIDLDGFKQVNDKHGHLIWNELLKQVAKRLQDTTRRSDMVARFGWDEFVVLIPYIHIQDIDRITVNIQKALQAPFLIAFEGSTTSITTTIKWWSIGVSIYPEHWNDLHTLTKKADTAMYAAKNSPNVKVKIYNDQLDRDNLDREQMEADLRIALSEWDQLFPIYQPIVDWECKIISMESLIRWNHPRDWLVSPVVFIPIAEKAGLIEEIWNFMLLGAAKQIKNWLALWYTPPSIAVNVSPLQLMNWNLLQTVSAVLDETGIPPWFLTLEITRVYQSMIKKEFQ